MNDSTLHETIISSFLNNQRPPTIREIASKFKCDESEARKALRTLADNHGIVLHPHNDEVWIAHPFSSAPTTCVVTSGNGTTWWGNCAWCSLGVMNLVGGTASVETRIGAIGEHVVIRVENGELIDKDYIVHFPIPMKNAWDNVIYTCSVMLFFKNEEQVDQWCKERGIPKGDVRPIEQIWKFSKEWYGKHANIDWTKWTMKEASDIFAKHGLDGPIWTLETQQSERF